MKLYQGHRTEKDKSTAGECTVIVIDDGFARELEIQPSLKLRNHSPDGFNWGYGGSGPAQLALAILLDFTKDEIISQHLYQQFKFEIIAKLPAEKDWTISDKQITDWLVANKEIPTILSVLLDQATDRPWYCLEVMNSMFIAAKPTDDHPYFNKTKNIDIVGDEDYPRKQDDCNLIVSAINMLPILLKKIEKLQAEKAELQKELDYIITGHN